MLKKISLFLLFAMAPNFWAQQAEFLKLNKFSTAVFSDTLKENSGLTFLKNELYTHNDGGNTSDIFRIDRRNGKILQKIPTDLKNIDWEAITNDGRNIFIGEFGNNAGTRKDLKIYKIPMDSSFFAKDSTVTELPFYYPEQTDFTRRIINNDFDAEAMVYLNGKIHIFTKEWASRKTTHYILDPDAVGEQAAQKIETFDTGYVVTDAEYFKGKLYLIGYTKKTEIFLTIFNETKPGVFFSEKPRKFYLGSSIKLGQIEGIAADENGIYISGEEFRSPLGVSKPRLYFVPHSKFR